MEKAEQLLKEIIRLAEQLKRESEETEGYIRRGDHNSALRNTNDNRDELHDLVRKWDELTHLLNSN